MTALSPHYAIQMFIEDPFRGFLAMGAAVLAVTGAEALYADMGHFGRSPIRFSWLFFVLPALVLNYLGQASLLMRDPASLESPFYLLAPDWFQYPLLIIASLAAVIASQAVITGAFSVTQQAIQLGFIPRMSIKHTSETAAGQIYIPVINWALMIAVILLVLVFQRSSNLTAAYGIAVTGAMLIDNFLLAVVLFQMWKWKWWMAVPLLAMFFAARHRLSRRQPDQDPRWRLGAAGDRPGHLHPADHLVARAGADAPEHGRRHRSRSRSSPRARTTAPPASRAPRSSWPRPVRACPRRCSTTSSTTRCCTNAW